jgi:predicted TIM-barrel fold metal-dependent hydrolase
MISRSAPLRSAGCQTCCIADFQIGESSELADRAGCESRAAAAAETDPALRPRARTALTRRDFIKTTALSAAVGFYARPAAAAPPSPLKLTTLVDVNVTLGRWPFRRLPLDETPALAAKLRQHGVAQAWAGSFDGLLHKNLAAANARLAAECRKHGRGLLVPFGSVNPTLPDWEEDLRRCAEVHGMPGVRLHPNYHGYPLDAPAFARLLALAAERHLLVQLVADMEDERMQHRLARVPHLDAKLLPGLLRPHAGLRLVLLNWSRSVNLSLVKPLADRGVSFDIATLENVGGVANLIQQISAERVLFGSHAPFFYFESSLFKLKESALPVEQSLAVRTSNARRLLAPGG